MATRRIINTEKTLLEKDDHQEEKSNISPAVPKHVIFKLLGFTLAMIVIPIGSYFVTVDTLFKGTLPSPLAASAWAFPR
ncbi:Vacuolar ATPase assembly integral membrane protein VMA21 [Hirsutella minnesotensis 3608]|nr:Vacuolar ATPase assembly integral membrane protein VMA21 [Hirsutella minnesotensis 3608]